MQPAPVPLSAGFEQQPSASLVMAALAAVRAVVAPTGPWPTQARRLVEAVCWKAELSIDPDSISPATFAHTRLVVRDPIHRIQLVRLVIAAALVDGLPSSDVVARVEALAATLEVDVPEVRDLRLIAERRMMRLRRSMMPRFWVIHVVRAHARAHGWWSVVRMMAVFLRLAVDRKTRARFEALERLPEGTLGRRLLAFWRKAGFAVPGERGAMPAVGVYHDVGHVLSGYGTDPASEVQAGCFQAGFQRTDGFTLVLFVLCQFQLAIRMTPIAKGEIGMFDPFRALDAVCRGVSMNRDITDGTWDLWAHVADDVELLRERLHVPPAAWPVEQRRAA